MRKTAITLVSIFILSSCQNDFNSFQEKSLKFLDSDNSISKHEYETLSTDIKKSNEASFTSFKTDKGEIDNQKLNTYLLKFFKSQKRSVTAENIWSVSLTKPKIEKFNVNVYLENSASIDGYVGQNSNFKTTVFKLLTDLKNFSLTKNLNLNYINTRTIPVISAASRDDIDDFYERLNPADFRRAGGERGDTDIEKMFRNILDEFHSKPGLSVFISDCVFSPGRGQDATRFLDGQYAAIYNDFLLSKNSLSDISLVILQCKAKFEGNYYDLFNQSHIINLDRPYYLWMIGSSDQIRSLIDNKIFDLIKAGYTNKLVIQGPKEANTPKYRIQLRPRIGEFSAKNLANNIISKAKASKLEKNKGIFSFNIAVDYSSGIQDAIYYLDTSNFKISNTDYSIEISEIKSPENLSLKGFTHLIKLSTQDLKDEVLTLDIIGKAPSWVYNSTSYDDTRIGIDPAEENKTFGFKYLVEGVTDAFYPKSGSNIISSINITIEQ